MINQKIIKHGKVGGKLKKVLLNQILKLIMKCKIRVKIKPNQTYKILKSKHKLFLPKNKI
jgi:hypothetical protein